MKNGETSPRTAVPQDERGLGDAFDAANSGADQNAAYDLIVIGARVPVRVVKRLCRRRHRKDDKIVHLALLLWLHPVVGVEAAGRAVAAGNLAGNLAGDIRDIEFFDALDSAVTGNKPPPRLLDAASERRHQSQTCDDDPSHQERSRRQREPKLTFAPGFKNLPKHHPPAHGDVQFRQRTQYML